MTILSGQFENAKRREVPYGRTALVVSPRPYPIAQLTAAVRLGGKIHHITAWLGEEGKFQITVTGAWAIREALRVLRTTFFHGDPKIEYLRPTNSHAVVRVRDGVHIDIFTLTRYMTFHPELGVFQKVCAHQRHIGSNILYIEMSQFGEPTCKVNGVIGVNSLMITGLKSDAPYLSFLCEYICESGAVTFNGHPCTDPRVAFRPRDGYAAHYLDKELREYIRTNRPRPGRRGQGRIRGKNSQRTVAIIHQRAQEEDIPESSDDDAPGE